MSLDAVVNQLLRQREARAGLLERPDEIDKLVSHEIDDLQPVVAKPQYSKYPDKISAIDAAMPEDHPMRGYSQKVRESTEKLLATPEFSQYKPKDIARTAALIELQRPNAEGATPLEGDRDAGSGQHRHPGTVRP